MVERIEDLSDFIDQRSISPLTGKPIKHVHAHETKESKTPITSESVNRSLLGVFARHKKYFTQSLKGNL